MPNLPLLLSKTEAAHQLGDVSVRTIERMIIAGDLPSVLVRGRRKIPADAIHFWLAKQLAQSHNGVAGVGATEEKLCHTSVKTLPIGGFLTATQAAKKLTKVAQLSITPKPKR